MTQKLGEGIIDSPIVGSKANLPKMLNKPRDF